MLCRWPWPGNMRELQNVIERAVILSLGRCCGSPALSSTRRRRRIRAGDTRDARARSHPPLARPHQLGDRAGGPHGAAGTARSQADVACLDHAAACASSGQGQARRDSRRPTLETSLAPGPMRTEAAVRPGRDAARRDADRSRAFISSRPHRFHRAPRVRNPLNGNGYVVSFRRALRNDTCAENGQARRSGLSGTHR